MVTNTSTQHNSKQIGARLCALSVVGDASDTLLPFRCRSEIVSTLRRGKTMSDES